MTKKQSILHLTSILLASCLLLFATDVMSAQKAKGEVSAVIKAGEAPCNILKGLAAMPDECSSDGLPEQMVLTLIQSDKKPRLKKDQAVLLKARDAGKTPGKVVAIFDLPLDIKAFKERAKDAKNLVLWKVEDEKTLIVIRPDKDFIPEKGQQVRLKVKEVTKVEGC